jgi:ribosome maturation factor RimP
MIEPSTVRAHLKEILAGTGFFLIDVRVDKSNKIVVHVDRNDGIGIDDCVMISRKLESRLDRDKEDFALEVSSPGLDSPFKVIEQYHKNMGKRVKVIANDGRTTEGLLRKVSDDGIEIDIPETISMKFIDIQSVRRAVNV